MDQTAQHRWAYQMLQNRPEQQCDYSTTTCINKNFPMEGVLTNRALKVALAAVAASAIVAPALAKDSKGGQFTVVDTSNYKFTMGFKNRSHLPLPRSLQSPNLCVGANQGHNQLSI